MQFSSINARIDRYKQYAPAILRLALSLVFIWFGLNQIFNQSIFIGYLPKWAFSLPFSTSVFLTINGVFETFFGTLLLFGLFTRIVALLLSLHLFGIAFSLGYNDIAVRDIGLALAAFSVFINGPDSWTVDTKLKNRA